MPDTPSNLEQQVEAMILAGLDGQEDTPTQATEQDGETRKVIDVDLYRLHGGAVLLVPSDGTNPLDKNAVESVTPTETEQDITQTPTTPLIQDAQQEETLPQPQPEPEGTQKAHAHKRVKRSYVLLPVFLLLFLALAAGMYWYVLPAEATADITITPQAKTLQKVVTFTIATHSKAGEVQGRELTAISLTQSKTVPATGKAHQDATNATGVITFYNTDSQSYTIPAGMTFSAPDGATIVTDEAVTVQAAILPEAGQAIVNAHVLQAGSIGNIAARSIYTRCCGSEFITATNTTPFTGGQNARSYSYVQSSDIQNAATDLLNTLTPRATTALSHEIQKGESLVTPLCNPHTQVDAEPGEEAVSVTVSVTQTCTSVAYMLSSLNQVATSTLVHLVNLTSYQEEGATQVIISGSTYTDHTATLKVSLSGTWVYSFSQKELTHLKALLAGESTARAYSIVNHVLGVRQVHIHVKRLDLRDSLPTNPRHISIQFFYLVS